MTDKILALLKSRRFWTAVGGVVVVATYDLFGLPEDVVNSIVALVIAWIVGDSLRSTI